MDQLSAIFKNNDFITLEEARSDGISPMMLSRMVFKEQLFRVDRAVYAYDLDWLTDPIRKYQPVCTLIPDAIISGISALNFYNLSDHEERHISITIPSHRKLADPRYKVTRAQGPNYTLGINKYHFGRHEVRIYDIEKSVVDAFKYQTEEIAFKALKRYLKRSDKDLAKLSHYAKSMRKPLDTIIRALLADG